MAGPSRLLSFHIHSPLDAFHAAGAPLAGTETPDSTLVLMTTV